MKLTPFEYGLIAFVFMLGLAFAWLAFRSEVMRP